MRHMISINGVEKVMSMSKERIWLRRCQQLVYGSLYALTLLALARGAIAAGMPQKSFGSPEEAVSALVEAVRSGDESAMKSVLGPRSGRLVDSGDTVQDQQNRDRFVNAYDEANRIELQGETKAVLIVGNDNWPMPIPIVKSGDSWRFDAKQGAQEILNRRIGRNELAAVQVCLAIVDAEREYSSQNPEGASVPRYAARLASTPGERDGLYWKTTADQPESPLGPLLAAAANEGYTHKSYATLAPYHGYYYKLLTRQGKNAPGGAYDYLVKGEMLGGFGVLAYPARYRASGVMSFIVNQDGVVYEKDLGKNTASIAAKMTTFDPDPSWKKHD
ncbi:MAG TPA: DUF2950 domain-containing protein [Burkholderiales bacterium]|nr:DUF2950 domain-containing protein [Burkholderiales bacterium]